MMSVGFKSRLNQLWDMLFSEGISSPIAAIDQLSYLFFIKWLEVTDDPNDSIFEGSWHYTNATGGLAGIHNKQMRWSSIKSLNDSERVEFIATVVFTWLKNQTYTRQHFSNYLYNCVLMITRPSLLAEAMEAVESAFPAFENTNPDDESFWGEPAEAYEFLLEKMIYQRSNIVRTPPELADMLCSLAAPHATDTVCDPACGTGDLLIAAKKYVQKNKANSRSSIISKVRLYESLTGYEADAVIARLAMMNLMLHGIGNPKISQKSLLVAAPTDIQFSLIISAPTAVSMAANEMIEFGRSNPITTQLLFLEELIKMLNIEGRATLLIPENILIDTDAGAIQLREKLMETCNINALLMLPAGSVSQYSTGMAILCFAKYEQQVIKNATSHNVWFYEIKDQDYLAAEQAYEKRGVSIAANRKGQQFHVPLSEIRASNFSLSIQRYRQQKQEQSEPDTIDEELEKDIPGIGKKTLGELITEEKRSAKKSLPVYSGLISTYAKLLPEDHKDLIGYLQHLPFNDILHLSKSIKEDSSSYLEKLVNLLQAKKDFMMAEANKLANEHPYYTQLHRACELKNEYDGKRINLLDIVRAAGLKDFTISQLLDVLMADKKKYLDEEDRMAAEEEIAGFIETALIQFFAENGKAFTFQTLQKVLAQLQFLPAFGVLRKLVWVHLGRDGFLRQLYIGKERTAQTPAADNRFELFTDAPGHLHLVHADYYQQLQSVV